MPASNDLSKSTSLGSARAPEPVQEQPDASDEGKDVEAAHPLHSPFGSPPPPTDLPERHLGPPVQEDHPPHVKAAISPGTSLMSPTAPDSSYTLRSRSGSDNGRVSHAQLAILLPRSQASCIASFTVGKDCLYQLLVLPAPHMLQALPGGVRQTFSISSGRIFSAATLLLCCC